MSNIILRHYFWPVGKSTPFEMATNAHYTQQINTYDALIHTKLTRMLLMICSTYKINQFKKMRRTATPQP